ncbi:MAG: hypothetical protein ABFD69_06760 [Candidatus Sumerlaeia bacterium]
MPQRAPTRTDAVSLAWGLAEATFFFIVPDVLLSRVVLRGWKGCLRATAAAIVGALIGGAIMFGWGAANPTQAMRFVDHVPAISTAMVDNAGARLETDGWPAFFTGAAAGVPYKVYAVHAGRLRVSFIQFMIASALARAARFLIVCGLASLIANTLKRLSLPAKYRIHAACWVLFYAWYFWKMSN